MEDRAIYLNRRADEEDAAADRASSDKARQVHRELAARYRVAAGSDELALEPETVSSTISKDFRVLD